MKSAFNEFENCTKYGDLFYFVHTKELIILISGGMTIYLNKSLMHKSYKNILMVRKI